MAAEGGRKLKLGDPVRFTRRMAGFKVETYADGYGSNRTKTTDPTDGMPDRWRAADDRLKELVGDDARYGHYRVVVDWEVPPRREYDLLNHDRGILVGKTFRYEGRVHFEDGWMSHVGPIDGSWSGNARRVECWEVKQTLNRKAVLVPLDAVELIPVCPACGERAEHFDPERGVDGEWTCITVQYGACRTFRA